MINIIIAPLNQGHRVSPSLQFLPSGETDQFFLRRAPLAATLVFSFLAAYRTTCQSVSANYWRSGGGGPWGGMRAKSRSSQQLGKDVRFFLPFHSARKRRTYKKKKRKGGTFAGTATPSVSILLLLLYPEIGDFFSFFETRLFLLRLFQSA